MQKISYTIEEAVAATGLSQSTFYNLFKAGKLTPHKSGRRVLILASQLEEYIKSLSVAA